MTQTTSISTGAALIDLYPQLSNLSKSPAFLAAIADDCWLNEIGTFLRIPDFLEGEDVNWAVLTQAVPELEAFDFPTPRGVETEAALYRRRARRAAVRAIACACNLGSPTFVNHPLLAGDPSIKISPAPGLNCRIGAVSSVAWRPSPSVLTRVVTSISDEDTLREVERAHFPLLAASDYEEHFAHWKSLAPLREWDEQNRLPLIGVRAIMENVPARYVERYTEEDLAETGVPFVVATRIVSPYAAVLVRALREATALKPQSAENLILWAVSRCES